MRATADLPLGYRDGKRDRQAALTLEADELEAQEMILEALKNPNWDFRTVVGLSRETGLEKDIVEGFLEKGHSKIRKLIITDKNGNDLYTLRSRSTKFWEILSIIQQYIAKN